VVGWELATGALVLEPEPPSWTVTVTVTVSGDCGFEAMLDCWVGIAEYPGVWAGSTDAAGADADATGDEGLPDACGEAAGDAPESARAAVGLTNIALPSCSLMAFEVTSCFATKSPTFGIGFAVKPTSRQVV